MYHILINNDLTNKTIWPNWRQLNFSKPEEDNFIRDLINQNVNN